MLKNKNKILKMQKREHLELELKKCGKIQNSKCFDFEIFSPKMYALKEQKGKVLFNSLLEVSLVEKAATQVKVSPNVHVSAEQQ